MSGPTFDYGERVSDFSVGDRVELHPVCDQWMAGDKYGEVVSISEDRGEVRVELDVSVKVIWVSPDLLRIVR